MAWLQSEGIPTSPPAPLLAARMTSASASPLRAAPSVHGATHLISRVGNLALGLGDEKHRTLSEAIGERLHWHWPWHFRTFSISKGFGSARLFQDV
jgi:hypothetical protein